MNGDSESDIQSASSDLNGLLQKVTLLDDQNDNMETALRNANEKNQSQRKSIDKMNTHQYTLEQKLTDMTNKARDLTEHEYVMKQRIEDLESKGENLEDRLRDAVATIKDMRQKAEQLGDRGRNTKRENGVLHLELKHIKAVAEKQARKLESFGDLVKENQDLKKQLYDADDTRQDLARLRSTATQLSNKLNSCNRTVREAETRLGVTMNKNRQLEQIVHRAEEAVKDAHDMQRQLSEVRNHAYVCNEKNKAMVEDLGHRDVVIRQLKDKLGHCAAKLHDSEERRRHAHNNARSLARSVKQAHAMARGL